MQKLNQLAWTVNRLRTMDKAELVYRVRQAVQSRVEARGWNRADNPPRVSEADGKPWTPVLPRGFDAAPYRLEADRILAGRFDIFALRDEPLGFPPQWNRDPKTGTVAPLMFGKRLNYRDESLVGDCKYLWEPSRHLQMTTLAQAYHLSGEMRYAEGVRDLLTSWLDQCPYPSGMHWVSALELAIRLMNWSVSWHLLGGLNSPLFRGEAGERFKERWLQSVYQHCHFIDGYFSRHSSANNHLFTELLGLYVAALTWPCWKESKRWLAQTHAELEAEAIKQNHADGVNCEQAIYYHHQVVNIMLLCALLGRVNGLPASAAFMDRLERMIEFVASVMDTAGAVPMIGDADDAALVPWGADGFDPYRSLLATGAVLFGRSDFKHKAGGFDEKSRWLLGDAAAASFAALPVSANGDTPRRAFEEGGYYVLGDHFGTDAEVRLVADAGPLGYLSICAHGHADALAFTLSVGGEPVLIDPGTYAYHTQKKWRDYFRGTSAHNTVRIDGQDQSESGGNFMWLRKARVQRERWTTDSERDELAVSHDGYTRLSDPVRHRRRITYLKAERRIVVDDTLECSGIHDVEFHWHFSERCVVRREGAAVVASVGRQRVVLTPPQGQGALAIVSGQEDPPLGWISHRMDEKVPSPVVVWRETVTGTVRRTMVFDVVSSAENSTALAIDSAVTSC
jgi:hypothetical protein